MDIIMKKISLVTGANGHLGNNLVRELSSAGINKNYDLATSKKNFKFNPKSGKETLEEHFARIFINLQRKENI